MSKDLKRKWVILLGVVVLILIGAVSFYQITKGLVADVLEVQPRSFAITIEEKGTVVAQVMRPIHPAFAGQVIKLPVAEGQLIEEGQVLAVVNSQEFALLRLQINNARSDLISAQNRYDRLQALFEEGAVTKQELEDAQALLQSAQNRLQQQLEAFAVHGSQGTRIEPFGDETGHYAILAPIAGIASNLNVDAGELVTPGAPLMTIYQPDVFKVETYLLTEDVQLVEVGSGVKLIQERRNEQVVFLGEVESIAPFAEPQISALGLQEQRVRVTVTPQFPDQSKVAPGFELDVQFILQEAADVLVVPKTALFKLVDGDALWVAKEGRAKIQHVQTGLANDTEVIINDGLNRGDQVILNPQLKGLREGKKIVAK